MSIGSCKLIDIPLKSDERGSLVFVEAGEQIHFNIKRNYILFGIKGDEERGHHAHKELFQLVMCLNGSFEVELFDGKKRKTFALDSITRGLLIGPMVWRVLRKFSSDAVCSVLASEKYDEADYIRNMDDFVTLTGDGQSVKFE